MLTETETSFLNREIAVWGEDYVNDLIDRGYLPVLTSDGWYWLLNAGNHLTTGAACATVPQTAFYSRLRGSAI